VETKILDLFRKHKDDYLSGEEISRRLKVTRAAIWKHIEKLRQTGYDIEAQPHLGYRLKAIPDKMIPDEIQNNLETKIFGKTIYSYESTNSTNDIAYDLAEKGAKEGVIVIAEEQKKGKGRLGRSWASPKGGIYLSVIIRPDIMPAEIQEFTLVAALSVAKAISQTAKLVVQIKWPNDILLNEKKVCGILAEMKAESDKIDFVILGIGVNANIDSSRLPNTATSLNEVAGSDVARIELARSIITNLEKYYFMFKKEGFDGRIRNSIKDLSCTLGKHVKIQSHSHSYEGEATDIDEKGALLVRHETGLRYRILSGDVTFIG
jgi:BirA family biotin operon repressor/biotin-[acetyl-CoA-carboxylase] ligase